MFSTHVSDILGYLLIGPIGWSWKYFISGKKMILSETYVAPKLNSGTEWDGIRNLQANKTTFGANKSHTRRKYQ